MDFRTFYFVSPPGKALRASLALLMALPALFPSASPRAGCGLHSSPFPITGTPETLALGLTLRRTAIEQSGDPGVYSEMDFETHYAATAAWILGAQWPVAMIDLRGSKRIGLGNPAVQAEFRTALGAAARLGLGAQLELPLGDADHGFASDRFMGGLNASLSRASGRTTWSGSLGAVSMLPWMDAHAAGMDHASMHGSMPGMVMPSVPDSPTSLVGMSLGGPHENCELLYRFGAGLALFPARVAIEAALDGQHVLSEPMRMDPENPDAGARNFLTAELELPVTLGASVVSPFARCPVSPARRTGWSLGMRTGVAW